MKTANDFHKIQGIAFFMLLLLLSPGISIAQGGAPAAPDPSIVPWLGVWRAVEEPILSNFKTEAESGVLEIRPTGSGTGLEITRPGAEKPVSETIIPDGFLRTAKTGNCTAAQTYHWEEQTGLLMGSSDIQCPDSASHSLSNIKMMITPGRMADILAIKTSGQTRIAVRHFIFEQDLASEAGAFPDQAKTALRSALSAPWDLDKIIHLSKRVETPVLQAILLEKDAQVRVDLKSLKRLKAAGVPDDVVDLLVALALPEKFEINRNGKVAVASRAPAVDGYPAAYVYSGQPFADPYGYYGFYGNYSRYGYPWGSYLNYASPFWWGYPLYIYPVPVGGGGGGGGGGETPPLSSGGRLSSEHGYVEITPRDAGPKAVPRNGAIVPSGNSGRVSGGGSAVHVPSSGGGAAAPSASGGGYSGGGSNSGATSAPTASPSGYSGGGGGGQAVPRNQP